MDREVKGRERGGRLEDRKVRDLRYIEIRKNEREGSSKR